MSSKTARDKLYNAPINLAKYLRPKTTTPASDGHKGDKRGRKLFDVRFAPTTGSK
jgi:hypothetical protein